MNKQGNKVTTKPNTLIKSTLQIVVWLLAFILSAIIVYYSNVDNTINRQIQVTSAEFSGGSGTEGDPYKISTFADLQEMATLVNNGTDSGGLKYAEANYKLMADIDDKTSPLTTWTPIGDNSTSSARFRGTFDGQGHKITFNGNVTISTKYAGLFGYVSSGIIKNLGIHWNSLTGTNTGSGTYVGGIAGYSGGTIINSYNTGSVEYNGTGSSSKVGGIAGENSGTISNSYNTGSVTCTGSYSYVGGIAGSNFGFAGENSGTISNSYNTGSVTGTGRSSRVGGIAGENSGTISNSYNTGSVEGSSSYVGGIAGINYGTISNCFVAYSGTAITIQGNTVGGVVGDDIGAVNYCYYDSGITLDGTTKDTTGETTGLNTIVTNPILFITGVTWGTNNKWDFVDVWVFASGVNNNFPVLRVLSNITNFNTITCVSNDSQNLSEIVSVSNRYTIPILTPTAWQNANTGYEFLYWTDSNNQYSVGKEITVSQDMTLTAQWEQAKSTIDFTITNNTGDTVLVVFKYKDSIATFRVVGDISATSGVTKNYSFKVAPQSGCVIYIIGGNYTTTLTVDGVSSTPSGNSYTIDCSNDVTMTLTVG